MTKIIGGLFPLPFWPHAKSSHPAFWGEKKLLLANGRCGLWLLRDNKVWMPSYCCDSMISALPHCRFYEVDEQLRPKIPSDLQDKDLFIIINYFGMQHEQKYYEQVKASGAIILEDASWSFFTKPNPLSDYILYSPGKICGIPDGGILLCRHHFKTKLEPPSEEWWQTCYLARLQRFLTPDDNSLWYSLFLKTKDAPVGAYAMSKLSQTILENFFDYTAMAERYKKNYERLSKTIKPLLSVENPTGFPILIKHRDELQKTLAEQRIFCPVLWPLLRVPGEFQISHHLSRHMLVLPCDYRYDESDMDRIINSLTKLVYE